MQETLKALSAAFKREPEQTKWLLRIGLGGPLLIVAWDVLGGLALAGAAVSIIDGLAILVYGAVISMLIAQTMHASERWGVESAITARKFSTRVQKATDAKDDGSGQVADSHAAFRQAHFLTRLKEEVGQARRDGAEMSVIWLDVGVPGLDPLPSQNEKMALDVAELLASQAKTIGSSLDVNLNEYVFTIPQGKAGAHGFVRKLILGLGKYWCHCGIVEYPRDAMDAEALFKQARGLCEASRQGKEAPEPSEGRIAATS